jgi:hypothetical protein
MSPKNYSYLRFLRGCIFDMSINKRMAKNMGKKTMVMD